MSAAFGISGPLLRPLVLAWSCLIGLVAADPGCWPVGEGACRDTPLRLTLAAAPDALSGTVEIVRVADGRVVDAIDLAAAEATDRRGPSTLRCQLVRREGTDVIITPHAQALGHGEEYAVRLPPGAFPGAEGIARRWRFRTKPAPPAGADRLVVAVDGSGDFCSVQGAVDHLAPHRQRQAEIVIRRGIYDGIIRIPRDKPGLRLAGEDRQGTVLRALNNARLNSGGLLQRCVLGIEADDTVLENLTVENTTPYKGSQAEAVSVNAQRCVLRQADVRSFQDTLCLSGRVLVSRCQVDGDVDFIWGSGTAVFAHCRLRAVHDGYYVQSRSPADRSGFVFLDCELTAAPEVRTLWLARIEGARFPASQVAFIRCRLAPQIAAAGWLVSGDAPPSLRFWEYGSRDADGRVLDVGRRHPASRQLTAAQAAELSIATVLAGEDGWRPDAGAAP